MAVLIEIEGLRSEQRHSVAYVARSGVERAVESHVAEIVLEIVECARGIALHFSVGLDHRLVEVYGHLRTLRDNGLGAYAHAYDGSDRISLRHLGGVGEIDKLHHSVGSLSLSEAIRLHHQVVGHISRRQHVEHRVDVHHRHRSLHRGIEVDEKVAKHIGAALLRAPYQLHVGALGREVKFHVAHLCGVDSATEREGIFIYRQYVEFMEIKHIVADSYRISVKAEAGAEHIDQQPHRVARDASVEFRLGECAAQAHVAVEMPRHLHRLRREERIGYLKWETGEHKLQPFGHESGLRID